MWSKAVLFLGFAVLMLVVAPPARGDEIEAGFRSLLLDLSSPNFTVRQRADQSLLKDARYLPHLRSVKSDDPELRKRVSKIIGSLEAIDFDVKLSKSMEKFSSAGLDLFVESMAANKNFRNDDRWQAGLQFALLIADHCAGRDKVAIAEGRLQTAPLFEQLNGMAGNSRYAKKEGLGLDTISASYVFASGGAKRVHLIDQTVIFISGDVESISQARSSVIVVDGSIAKIGLIANSVVVATGNVGYVAFAEQSGFCIRGRLNVIGSSRFCKFDAATFGQTIGASDSIFIDQVPLGVSGDRNAAVKRTRDMFVSVRFFDVSSFGIALREQQKEAELDRVDPQSDFRKAGFEAGDRIVSIGGIPINSPADFRLALRRAVADGAKQTRIGAIRRTKSFDALLEFTPQ
ncbi:MAG: hypothetical protein K2X38_21475 [Gemmataceae bacterium]|nr:hypothetical protein [Gemmataceae bacterium]